MMTIVWIVTSFDWYTINFYLKYINGDIYTNTIVSYLTQIPAYIISGILYEKLGVKNSLIILFLSSFLGSIAYTIIPTQSNVLIASLILGTKFGVTGTFNIVFIGSA